MAQHEAGALPRCGVRAMISAVVLAAVWAVAFTTGLLPFLPSIVAGGVVTGLAGLWVRRGTPDRPETGPGRPRFPRLLLEPAHIRLAVRVAVMHFALGHALFWVGGRIAPALTETAAAVYTRIDGVPLWAAVMLGAALTAPLEEVFWRGAVQPLVVSWVGERLPRLAALPGGPIIAAAAVYALFHAATGQIALVAAALLGGLVWGWLLDRTRSVGAPMLAHGLWTALMLAIPPV